MEPYRHFRHCPRCGEKLEIAPEPADQFQCGRCRFAYYFNPAIAAAAFVSRPDGTVLFIRRAKEPAQGKLAIPGGFIDIGETAEEALRREIREEVNLDATSLNYFCSFPNQYDYQDVTYPVLDLFFSGRVDIAQDAAALDGVESLSWLDPARVDPEEIAFPSIRRALQLYCADHLRWDRRLACPSKLFAESHLPKTSEWC
ncbi:MAG: NUDIX domain-containing protein [Verrucomicrobia bacterium]|nr:NUDIX domain-containing protein [Verrucomicrobiota bacterium]